MEDPAAVRRRRRPETRGGRPTLTRELIAEAMLELAGRIGFRAVTMRVLAAHLGVTVRALYNYAGDRQEIVDRAAALFVERIPAVPLDPQDWERGVAEHCHALRSAYRRHPRALLVSLDERISDTGSPAERLRNGEAMLAVLCAAGLSLRDAVHVQREVSIRVFGFVLLVDHRHDLDESADMSPVPAAWLDAHPDLDLPLLREAATTDLGTVDDAFAELVEDLLAGIRLRLR